MDFLFDDDFRRNCEYFCIDEDDEGDLYAYCVKSELFDEDKGCPTNCLNYKRLIHRRFPNRQEFYALLVMGYDPLNLRYIAACPFCHNSVTEKDVEEMTGKRFSPFKCPKCKKLLRFPSSAMEIDDNTNEILSRKGE